MRLAARLRSWLARRSPILAAAFVVFGSATTGVAGKPTSLYAPPRAPTYSDLGESHLGNAFDDSYSITTGLLNKVLNVRAASPDTLHLVWAPTWLDLAPLGIQPPTGVDPTSIVVLAKATLVRFDRAFRGLDRTAVLQIRIRPVIDPIVWMGDVQPPLNIPSVGSPLAYGIPELEVEFFEAAHDGPKGAPIPERTWVRLIGSFVDRDFRLAIDRDPENPYLVPDLDENRWAFWVVENTLRSDFGIPTLENSVAILIGARFSPVFEQMLSEIPAPKFF
ncbi:MAG: hypothetical protein ACKO2K_17040, partial [Alphaproteobacteria bacterium]